MNVHLRNDQVDLIVLCLTQCRAATQAVDSTTGIDKVCRQFTRNRIDEIIDMLKVPK